MKRLARTLVVLLSLVGISMPVQANNGMTDMMGLMMEMFLWMMGGGSGGMNPYRLGGMGGMGGLGGLNNPLLANSMLGNPMLGNSLLGGSSFGNPSGWGNASPYNIQGLYSPPGYPGSAANYNPYTNPYNNTYSNPYTSPYYGNGYGNQPDYRGDYSNPYYPNQYPRNTPYSSSYYPGSYGARSLQAQSPDPVAPLVLQPIIVNTGEQDAVKSAAIATEPKFQPPVSSQTTAMAPAVTDYASNNQSRGVATPLSGRWQGVNGEYLELGEKRFLLRSNDTDLKGTYELKNSILKAEIPDRKEPVYMQYKMSDGHLMFRSEDGQLMLFRRLPKSYRPH